MAPSSNLIDIESAYFIDDVNKLREQINLRQAEINRLSTTLKYPEQSGYLMSLKAEVNTLRNRVYELINKKTGGKVNYMTMPGLA